MNDKEFAKVKICFTGNNKTQYLDEKRKFYFIFILFFYYIYI